MNKKAILDSVQSEIEEFFQANKSDEGFEEMENQVRDLMKKIGQQVLQQRIEQRVESEQGGYLGQTIKKKT